MTETPIPLETHGLTRENLLEIDYFLRLTRALEERLVALFRQSKVIGGLYRSLGQEGESVAAAYALDYKQGDVVQPLIRNMGSILVAGAKPADIVKQYMAKGDSATRGRARPRRRRRDADRGEDVPHERTRGTRQPIVRAAVADR